jgi:hypothetical protein
MAIFNSKLLVYQRVMFDATTIPNEPHMFHASIMCQSFKYLLLKPPHFFLVVSPAETP